MALKYCSISLTLGEVQLKTAVKYYLAIVIMAITKKFSQGYIEKNEVLYTASVENR
jgi:hypothetical protein